VGSRGNNGNGAVILHGVCDELDTYQSVKTTNFLSWWTGGYGRVLSGAVFTSDMAVLMITISLMVQNRGMLRLVTVYGS